MNNLLRFVSPWILAVSVVGHAPTGYAASVSESVEDNEFDALVAHAERERGTGRHLSAARTYVGAFRALSFSDRVGLMGELVIDNALQDYWKAYAQRAKDVAVLEEAVGMLQEYIEFLERARMGGQASVMSPRLLTQLERLNTEIDARRATEAMITSASAGEYEPEPEPEPGTNASIDSSESRESSRGTMEKAGIGLMISGGVVIVPGIVFLVRKPTPITDDPERVGKRWNTRPLGGLLLGSGALVAIVGGVLYGVAAGRSKRRPSSASIHPWMGPTGGGVGVAGHF